MINAENNPEAVFAYIRATNDPANRALKYASLVKDRRMRRRINELQRLGVQKNAPTIARYRAALPFRDEGWSVKPGGYVFTADRYCDDATAAYGKVMNERFEWRTPPEHVLMFPASLRSLHSVLRLTLGEARYFLDGAFGQVNKTENRVTVGRWEDVNNVYRPRALGEFDRSGISRLMAELKSRHPNTEGNLIIFDFDYDLIRSIWYELEDGDQYLKDFLFKVLMRIPVPK